MIRSTTIKITGRTGRNTSVCNICLTEALKTLLYCDDAKLPQTLYCLGFFLQKKPIYTK